MTLTTPFLYFAELLCCIGLVLAIRILVGRQLGPYACRLLWLVLIVKALLPWTIATTYHPVGLFAWNQAQSFPLKNISVSETPQLKEWAPPQPTIDFLSDEKSAPEIESPEPAMPASDLSLNAPPAFAVPELPAKKKPPLSKSVSPFEESASEVLPVSAESPALPWLWTPYGMLFVLWLTGALVLLGTALARNIWIVTRATRHPVAVPDWVQTIFLEARESLHLRVWPVLIVSPCVPSPCLVGAIRPRILLPESLVENDADRAQVRYLLLHELVHLKQGDIWFSWLWTLVMAVHWFNPLFWLLGRQVRLDCEAACDDRVLTLLENREHRRYGLALLDMMADLNPPPIRSAGLSAVIETRSHLERRLTMMTLHQKPTRRRTVAGAVVFLLLLAFCMTGYAEPRKPISAEKAKLIGYVEDFFMHNYRDVTMRKSLGWGEPKTDEKGNISITYKYDALIWDKDRMVIEDRFTFDKDGNVVDVQKVSKESPKRSVTAEKKVAKRDLQNWVEKFFSENFRDITERRTILWGEPVANDDGTWTIRYRYEATINNRDKKLLEQDFTFDQTGKYVGHETLSTKLLVSSMGGYNTGVGQEAKIEQIIKFVECLNEGAYESAWGLCNKQTQAANPLEYLKEFWENMQSRLGKYVRVTVNVGKDLDTNNVFIICYVVDCMFERGHVVLYMDDPNTTFGPISFLRLPKKSEWDEELVKEFLGFLAADRYEEARQMLDEKTQAKLPSRLLRAFANGGENLGDYLNGDIKLLEETKEGICHFLVIRRFARGEVTFRLFVDKQGRIGFKQDTDAAKVSFNNKVDEKKERADAFMKALTGGDFDNAFAFFNDEMKKAMPMAELKKIWTGLISRYGRFLAYELENVDALNGFQRFHQQCTFQRGKVTLMVVIDNDSKVTGLFRMGNAPSQVKPQPDSNNFGTNTVQDLMATATFDRLREGVPDWFFERDTNKDNRLTLEEYAAGKPQEEIKDEFDLLDANGDGILTVKEVSTFFKERREQDKRERSFMHAQKGWQAFIGGNHNDAARHFSNAVDVDDKNANAYQGYGWALWAQGRGDAAREKFMRCLELDPRNAAALNGLGQIFQAEGNEAKAIEYWTKGVEVDSRATGPMASLAKLYDGKDDYENAIKYYERWLRVEPDNDEAKAALEKVKRKRDGKPATAEDLKADAVEQSQKVMQEAWRAFFQHRFVDSEAKFREAIKIDPLNAHATQGLGWALRNQEKIAEAKKMFLACLKIEPENVAALNGLGQIGIDEGDEEAAIKHWSKAAELEPGASGPTSGLAGLYTKRGDHRNAVKYYELWLKAEPDNEKVKAGLEKVKRQLEGKPATAEDKKIEAADQSQDVMQAGWKAFLQHRYAEAETNFREAVRLDPLNAHATQGLGWALRNQKKIAEAKEMFLACLKIDPENIAALNGLGRVGIDENDEEAAIRYWGKAAELEPSAGGPVSGLAELYAKRGDHEKAIKYYELWLKTSPDNQKARQGLEKMKTEAKASLEKKAEVP